MRRPLAVLAVSLLLAACAGRAGPPSGTSPGSRPLHARILPGHDGLAFSLNRPAHVAVFEVVPGRGVGLVYPSYPAQGEMLSSGFHRPLLSGSQFRWAYLSTPVSPNQSRYLYLVASERPLDIDAFVHSPTALRSTLGVRRFAAWNPHALLDELDSLVVPASLPGDWTSDLYAIWPEPPRARDPFDQLIVLTCESGRRVAVPLRFATFACPNDTRDRVKGTPRVTEPGDEEGDSATFDVPSRRRPEPKTSEPDAPEAEPSRIRPTDPNVDPVPEPVRVEPRRPAEPRETPRPARSVEPRGESRRPAAPAVRDEPRRNPPRIEPRDTRSEPSRSGASLRAVRGATAEPGGAGRL